MLLRDRERMIDEVDEGECIWQVKKVKEWEKDLWGEKEKVDVYKKKKKMG